MHHSFIALAVLLATACSRHPPIFDDGGALPDGMGDSMDASMPVDAFVSDFDAGVVADAGTDATADVGTDATLVPDVGPVPMCPALVDERCDDWPAARTEASCEDHDFGSISGRLSVTGDISGFGLSLAAGVAFGDDEGCCVLGAGSFVNRFPGGSLNTQPECRGGPSNPLIFPDADGHFSFPHVEPGVHVLMVYHPLAQYPLPKPDNTTLAYIVSVEAAESLELGDLSYASVAEFTSNPPYR